MFKSLHLITNHFRKCSVANYLERFRRANQIFLHLIIVKFKKWQRKSNSNHYWIHLTSCLNQEVHFIESNLKDWPNHLWVCCWDQIQLRVGCLLRLHQVLLYLWPHQLACFRLLWKALAQKLWLFPSPIRILGFEGIHMLFTGFLC